MVKIKEAILVEGRYDKNTLSQIVDFSEQSSESTQTGSPHADRILPPHGGFR